jgi:hypothetical protein
VDKPLSQERLSEDTRSDEWVDQFEFDNRTHVSMFGYVENSDLSPIIKSHRALSAEVKRLQAIEQALQEFGLHNGTAQDVFDWLESTTGYKGADTNESN